MIGDAKRSDVNSDRIKVIQLVINGENEGIQTVRLVKSHSHARVAGPLELHQGYAGLYNLVDIE